MNWEKLATPPLPMFFVGGLAGLQADYYYGYISDDVFIGYLNAIFDAALEE